MVSKASDDFPDPLKPVITVKVLRGISTSIFFRLCCRAPCTVMRLSIARGSLYFSSAVVVVGDATGDSCVWESLIFKPLILYRVARSFRWGRGVIFHDASSGTDFFFS